MSQSDPIGDFNHYYIKSIDKLRVLYGHRGVTFACDDIHDPYLQVSEMLRAYKRQYDRLGVLFYSYQDDSLRTWLLKKDELFYEVRHLPREALIEAETDIRKALKVDLLLAARDAKNRGLTIKTKDTVARKSLEASIRKATEYLLPGSIATNLNGLKHLVVIPEFNISQFPLYLLQPYRTNAYLVDSVSISIAPHLCNLRYAVDRYGDLVGSAHSLKPKNPVIVGNPAFTKDTGYNLSPLPGAESEASTIATMLNASALTGKNATISKILEAAKESNLLYFATHGYADLENGLAGSFLAFTPDSINAKGLWNAKSIQEQNFDAGISLAVLSACQTGVGKLYDAGFIGIGRAFYKAGIDHTVMSLWSVDDAATKKLMTRFLKILVDEDLYFYPASHLRRAILEFKKEDPNPAHWAPFMLFGFPY
ncbi:MAG: hypothetical protein K0Q66_46 [Chitinophagaceae bacterium]|jgi:CHAT domain-containing protein|nr:hypothetical protein [Chitinophagaceae bacterium]